MRLQAVLERTIVYKFLKRSTSDGLVGLKKKLAAMVAAGFPSLRSCEGPFARPSACGVPEE
jgi:hypothetical protein